MTATMGTLLTRVRDRLNEASSRHWTDPQLRRWINEGAREVARAAECLLGTGTVTIVAGTRSYALSGLSPQPIRLHQRAEFTATGDTAKYPVTYREFDSMDQLWGNQQAITTGTPNYWTTWGFFPQMNLMLYPTPQSAGTLTLYYYRNPAELATDGSVDSTVVECPDGWEDCIVDYAEYRGLRNDNNSAWSAAKQEFDQRVARLVELTVRSTDGIGMILTAGGGQVPGWLAASDEYGW